jgi:multicomponent Na+:H+ antiporter subunit B
MSDEPTAADAGVTAYTESPIIMTTVRVVAPFVLTFGLFLLFHGTDGSGGGFQGGVVVGSVVVMLGFAYGIRVTRDRAGPVLPVVLMSVGVLSYVAIGVGSVALGGTFLEYPRYPLAHASKYGIEAVELAIGLIVSGVVVGLFFAIEAGVDRDGGDTP